ncbi:FliI/YscN family ATPase [Sphingobium sp. sgz301303]|uniref:FliI/YscN family ATPase n=2 Tax=unclassified Sphingobium TaxID=2611147 RepID=UPI0035A6B25A
MIMPPDHWDTLLPRLMDGVTANDPRPVHGRLRAVRGVLVHASLPSARIGELCQLRDPASSRSVLAEVIGFAGDEVILAPIGDLDGMSAQTQVRASGRSLTIPAGDGLLGRVMDPLGRLVDDGPPLGADTAYRPVQADPPHPLKRTLIDTPLRLGVRAIDGLITVARGQRIGLFGDAGVGKSSLLASIVAGTEADVIVIGLIGERGREVREFIDVQLGAKARARTVTVVATSDRPAMERVKAAHVATAVAEHFRDEGRHVLLVIDSVTRFARAQREMGLAAGEPPTRRSFPPSFFAALPRLLERAGTGARGSITALYTVLTEGEASQDPVAEEVKSILDGHIMLSPTLAQRNHFPAIDIVKSRSRLMDSVASDDHRQAAMAMRQHIATYQEVELLIRIGEYAHGNDPRADAAVARHDAIETFLRQSSKEIADFATTVGQMRAIVA